MQNDKKIRKGAVWIVFAICVLIVLHVVWMLFHGGTQIRSSRASPLQIDMRSVTTGLEAYYVDHKVYSPGKPYYGDLPFSLTTPLPFLTHIHGDPFNLTEEEIRQWDTHRLVAPWLSGLIVTLSLLVIFLIIGICVGMKIGRLIITAFWILPAYFIAISLILALTAKEEALYESLGAFLVLWLVILLGVPTLHAISWSRAYHYTLLSGLMLVMSLAIWLLYTKFFWQPNPISHQSFMYVTDGRSGWILISYGPNRELDMPVEEILNRNILLHKENETFFNWIFPYTYDPTNGTVSPGDIWRINQTMRQSETRI